MSKTKRWDAPTPAMFNELCSEARATISSSERDGYSEPAPAALASAALQAPRDP